MKFFAVPLVLATFGNSGLAGCYQAINGNWCSNPSDGGFCANWPLHPVPVPNATYPPYTNPENPLNPLNEELCAAGILASVGSTTLEVYQQWNGAGVDGFRVANWFFGAMGGAATITGCLQNFSSLTQANLWTPYWCGVNIRWQVMHSAAEISYFFNNFGCDLYAGGVATFHDEQTSRRIFNDRRLRESYSDRSGLDNRTP